MDVHAVDAQSDLLIADVPGKLQPSTQSHSFDLHSMVGEAVSTIGTNTGKPYGVFIVKVVIILAVAITLFVVYRCLHQTIERFTGIGIQHISCLVFMVLSVSTDMSTKAAAKQQGGHYAFDPAIAVVIVEACKLVVSLLIFGATTSCRSKDDSPLVLPTVKDVMVLAVPGLVYTCNNILVFEAIEKVPLATFAVIRETRLVWNALIWMALFKVNLGRFRWLAIIGVIFGCTANQVPKAMHSEFTWGVMYAFLLAFLNAAGGVACEFAMKMKAAMDINLQNAVIYASCSSLALLYLAVFRTGVFASAAAFFHGFQPECLQVILLQIITGLTVSRILKHVESVTKSMVAALCSPIVCFLGSAMMGVNLRWNEMLAAVLVVFSCLLFLKQGPLQTSTTKDEPKAIEK